LFREHLPPYLKKLDSFLNGRKFAAGNNLTYVDFHLFEILSELSTFDEETLNQYANLKNYLANFNEIP